MYMLPRWPRVYTSDFYASPDTCNAWQLAAGDLAELTDLNAEGYLPYVTILWDVQ